MGKSRSPCQGDFVGTSEDGVEISWPLFYETRHKDTPVAYLDPNVTSLREQTTTFWFFFQPKLLGCISGELSAQVLSCFRLLCRHKGQRCDVIPLYTLCNLNRMSGDGVESVKKQKVII